MKELTLDAQKRESATKGTVNAMRRSGRVPAIVYGDNESPVSCSVDAKQLKQLLSAGRNALISLTLADAKHPVLVKEIQRNAITRDILHVDFHRVSLKKKVEASVAIHVKGEAPGVKLGGGVLEHLVREIRVRCLPTEIPASLDADVSALQIGQALKVKDLNIPSGVEVIGDLEGMIINIVAPTILEEPTPGAAATTAEAGTAEPEVIKKGKVEEGEEGETPAAGAKAGAAPAGKAPATGAKPAEAKKPEGK
jgi:large subunit ribosomal protein L25